MRLPIDGTLDSRGAPSRVEEKLATGVSLVSAAIAALAFAVVALAIERGATASLDLAATEALHALTRTGLTWAMVIATSVAEPVMAIALTLFVGWLALRRYDGRAGALGLLQLLLSAAITFALKHLFHRARPALFGGPIEAGFSFPSWHATASVAVFGFLALLLMRIFPRARVALGIGAALLAFTIGLSRIYLGAHWPTDVLAGYLVGWILLLIGAALLERLPTPGNT